MQETLDERKKENVFHEKDFFFLKKKREIFSEHKNEIKQTKSLFVRKNSWIEWKREWKKKKKRRSFLENFAKENGKMFLANLLD